jgi:nicotinamidase-related amidase
VALEICGRRGWTELGEVAEPSRAAVLVVDMQNDFCAPGGRAERRGRDLTAVSALIPRLRGFLEQARRAGVRVIYIQNTVVPGGALSGPADLVRRAAEWGADAPLVTVEGTWGHRIVDELAPQPGDLVVAKFRQSCFVGTHLAATLRGNTVETVIVAGVATHACVEATARDALNQDFYVVVPRDGVAALEPHLHEAGLAVMEALLPPGMVPKAAEIIAIWAGDPGTGSPRERHGSDHA